jgi:Domain of unknown function (DUF4143)
MQGLAGAFRHFGGTTKELLIDNAKRLVQRQLVRPANRGLVDATQELAYLRLALSIKSSFVVPPKWRNAPASPCIQADWRSCRNSSTKVRREYLIELIPPYSRNSGQRVIKAPKLYSVDAALALAASRETTPTGFHLETLVASDLLVWRDGASSRDLYHWRLSSGQEVDFILEESRWVSTV